MRQFRSKENARREAIAFLAGAKAAKIPLYKDVRELIVRLIFAGNGNPAANLFAVLNVKILEGSYSIFSMRTEYKPLSISETDIKAWKEELQKSPLISIRSDTNPIVGSQAKGIVFESRENDGEISYLGCAFFKIVPRDNNPLPLPLPNSANTEFFEFLNTPPQLYQGRRVIKGQPPFNIKYELEPYVPPSNKCVVM